MIAITATITAGVTAPITALATVALERIDQLVFGGPAVPASGAAAELHGTASPQEPIKKQVTLTASFQEARSGWHGVPIFGHEDHLAYFKVTLINWNVQDVSQGMIQFTSRGGSIDRIDFPPMLSATMTGKPQASPWQCADEDEGTNMQALWFDTPPAFTYVTCGVGVRSIDKPVSRNDLVALVTLGGSLFQAQSK